MSCMDETAARRLRAAAVEILKADQAQSEAQLRRTLGLPAEPVDAEPGLTVSLRLRDSTAKVALVANDDGDLFVGVKALDGLGEDESSALAQLVTHLSTVTRLACDLQCHGIPGDRFSDDTAPGVLGPCTAAESARYAFALRQLLESLDGEIVVAALVGEGESDLLDPERQEVDRVRKFLDGRIVMHPEPSDLRGRALTVLNAFMDKLEATAQAHESSPSVVDLGDLTVGDGQAAEGDPQPSAAEPPAVIDVERVDHSHLLLFIEASDSFSATCLVDTDRALKLAADIITRATS